MSNIYIYTKVAKKKKKNPTKHSLQKLLFV